ncbi:MAG: hypothetical protein O2897_03830 [bacterium]|nr:hypothetical protein [bacterium]
MSVQTRRKRSTLSFKDVQIAYLMNGVPSIEKLHKDGKASTATIRRALSHLRSGGREITSLENWIQDNLGVGVRGRAAPQAGQERVYRAQQIKTSGPFLRLPLSALSIHKGEVVSVCFEKDRIVVKKV